MIDLRSSALKVVATAFALAATTASAMFVTAHLKNPAAPLRPSVLTVAPSIRPADVKPVTSTYAS
jgi:hypothetical protein